MDLLFEIMVAWFFVIYYLIYMKTGGWYYLLTSLGAALNLLYLIVSGNWEFAGLLVLLGSTLFFVGLASTLTFGAKLERERMQASSWKELLVGRVPEHLRRQGPSERKSLTILSFVFLLSALITFEAGKPGLALDLVAIGIVTGIYSLFGAREDNGVRS